MPRFCMYYPHYYSADSVQKKRRPTGRLYRPNDSIRQMRRLTRAVMTTLSLCSTTVQASIYLVAFAIEPIRQAVASSSVCTIRLPVEPAINTITLFIQAIFDPVATVLESVLDAVTGIRKRGATNDQQSNSYCNSDERRLTWIMSGTCGIDADDGGTVFQALRVFMPVNPAAE
jgi:hypothetical protein